MNYKHEIEERLRGKYNLLPVYNSVFYIPERLREYDPGFFVVFNKRKQKYEVHNLENPISSYCFTVTFDELDVRTIHHTWQTDIRVHGRRILKQLDKEQERMEKDQERQFKRWTEDVAKETRSLMSKTAWT